MTPAKADSESEARRPARQSERVYDSRSASYPAARTGFQFDIRTGVSVPFGSATGAPGDDLGSRYSVQWPLLFGLGAKVTREWYVGGYLGFGVGSEGSDNRVERLCDDNDTNTKNDIGCSAYTLRIGLEARYYLNPAGSVDPWLSYGIGFESASQSIDDNPRQRTEETRVSGIEFARLGAGFDWRPGRVFGFGPFVELAFGRYGMTHTEVNRITKFDGPIDDKAVHSWLTLGLRGVFFP